MSGDWVEAYWEEPSDSEYEREIAEQTRPTSDPSPAIAPVGPVIRCSACGGTQLTIRSTDPETGVVKFRCTACRKQTSISLPYGYSRCYHANTTPNA